MNIQNFDEIPIPKVSGSVAFNYFIIGV